MVVKGQEANLSQEAKGLLWLLNLDRCVAVSRTILRYRTQCTTWRMSSKLTCR
jgi:hypothetical protein